MSTPLTYSISGNSDGPAMVLIHGWPDSDKLWDGFVREFSSEYLIAALRLPGYGNAEPPVSLPELNLRIASAIDEICTKYRKEKIILIGHDWGALLSYAFEKAHPTQVDRLIALDVGGDVRPLSFGHALFFLSYQWWLVLSWFAGKMWPALGDAMARGLARLFRAPDWQGAGWRMSYLYFYTWRAILLPKYRNELLGRYTPSVSTLFLYGSKNPYPFHTPKWEKIVCSLPHSGVFEITTSGHWLMIDDPRQTFARIREWLGE